MKLYRNFLFMSLAATVIYSSCTPPPPPPPPSMGHYLAAASPTMGTFSVTGSAVSAAGAAGAKISITGEAASGNTVNIHINPYAGTTGTFSIAGETGCIYHTSPSSAVRSVSGTITLSATTPDIIGTFNYTATDGSTVTGSFNVAAP